MPSAQELVKQINGRVYFQGDEGYELARTGRLFVGNPPDRFPAAIVIASCRDDVRSAVQYARESELGITIRSGGHNWFGASLRDGCLLIDLGDMRSISVDPDKKEATVEPGASGHQLLRALEPYGLVYPVGHCPSVPLGGFLLGGGLGIGTERWGLGCDSVLGMTVVTPDGEILECDEDANSDYMWLARGGYTGMVGAVVCFRLRLHAHPACVRNQSMVFDVEAAAAVGEWLHAIKQDPAGPGKAVEAVLVLSQSSPEDSAATGCPRVAVVGLWALCDSEAEAQAALQHFHTPPAPAILPPQPPQPKTCLDFVLSLQAVYPDKGRYQVDSNWVQPEAPVRQVLEGVRRAFAGAAELGALTSHHLLCIYSPWAVASQPGPFGGLSPMLSLVCLIYHDPALDAEMQRTVGKLTEAVRGHAHTPGISEGTWTAGGRRAEDVYGERLAEIARRRAVLDPAGSFGGVAPVPFRSVAS